MENNILDTEEEMVKMTNRAKYLIIESGLMILMILSYQFSNPIVGSIGFFGLILFYLVSPGIRFRKKEISTQRMLFLYLQSLLIFVLLIVGLFKIESWFIPYLKELFMISFFGVTVPLVLQPMLEIKKRSTSNQMRFFLIILGLGLLIAFLGAFLKLESLNYASELMLLGAGINLINLLILGFLLGTNWKRYAYLFYYFPRVAFAFYLGAGIIIYELLWWLKI